MLVMKKITLNDASEYSCNAGEGPLASKTIGGIEVQGKGAPLVRDNRVLKGPLGRSLRSFAYAAHSAHSLCSASLFYAPSNHFAHFLVGL